MSNYEDNWEYADTPVSAGDDSNDDDANEVSEPSEPSLSDAAGANQEPSEPTLGEAWAALRQQFEEAGLGAGGVVTEPESIDAVVSGWRDRLEMPDKYGPEDLGPEEAGSDQPYPDESERAAHRPAYVGPAMPEVSSPNEWGLSFPITAKANEGGVAVTVPGGLQGWGDTVGKPFVDAARNEARLLQEPIDKARQGDYAGALLSLATTPQRGLVEVAAPLYGDYLKALGEPAKWVERDVEGSYLDVANDVARNPGVYQAITDPNRDYTLQPWVRGSQELPPGRDKIVQALAALPEQERQQAIYQLKSMAYSPQENQLKALEESKTKGWQKAVEENADPWAETFWQGVLDPLWMVPSKPAEVLFKPANLPLELGGGALKAGAGKLAERIPWAKATDFGKDAWQSGSRAVGLFYDELKPRLVDMRERVAQAIERDVGVPEAMRDEIAGKLRGFQIRTPGELLSTLREGTKGQPKIWDYLPAQATPDDAVPMLRDVGEQLKGLTNPTRETITQVFDDARVRARQWVDQAKEAAARMAPREQGQAAQEAVSASAGKEPTLWDTINRKRAEAQENLNAAKEEFWRRMEAQYPPANKATAVEGTLSDLANARKDAEIAAGRMEALSDANAKAASAGEGPAGKNVVGPKMPTQGEPVASPKMPATGEPVVGPEMPKAEQAVGPAGEGGGQVPSGTGGEPPGKPPDTAAGPAGSEEESLRRLEGLHPSGNKEGLRKTFLDEFEKETNKPFRPVVNAGENAEVAIADELDELARFGAIFASPNRGNLTLDEAVANLDSSGEKWFERGARAVAEVLIPDAETHRALGVWSDGAENSLAIIVGEAVDEATLDYLGSRLGHARQQKQVLRFKAHEGGPHVLYVFDVPTTDLQELCNDALARGVPEPTLVPFGSGIRVFVFDEFRKLRHNVSAFGGAHGATNRQSWFGTGRRLGDPDGVSRELADREYRRAIEAFEGRRLGDKPWRVFSHSARTPSEKDQPRREAGLAPPLPIPTSAELSDWPRELKAIYDAWLRSELRERGISVPDQGGFLPLSPAIGDFQSRMAAAIARAAARTRRARTSDDLTSPPSDSKTGSSGFGGAHGATNQRDRRGTGRWLEDPEGKSKEIAKLEYRRVNEAFERERLAGEPGRVFGYSPRPSGETRTGREARVGSPLSMPPAAHAPAQARGQRANAMLAHLNAALDDWQRQALAKLARPVGPALPYAIPQATANRWAQLLSNELRQAVGESAMATNRRLAGSATQRGVVANNAGAAIRSARAPHRQRPINNIPLPVRSPEPRPIVPASTSQRARTQADQARPRQVMDREKQLPRVPLSPSQQMAQLYRGTIAGDDYWSQKRSVERDGWAMVPDSSKRALEEYWQGTPLTRVQVQHLMPVYRQYVRKTGYAGDMVQWVTATLKQQRFSQTRPDLLQNFPAMGEDQV